MAYVPTNVAAYTAAFSGALAGMAVSGWITDDTPANYQSVTTIAGAFAEAFDTAWNDATSLNNLETATITAVVQEDFKNHGPGPLDSIVFQTASNWAIAAKACVALILECNTYFAGQGIIPPSPGGVGPTVQVLGSVTFANGTNIGANSVATRTFDLEALFPAPAYDITRWRIIASLVPSGGVTPSLPEGLVYLPTGARINGDGDILQGYVEIRNPTGGDIILADDFVFATVGQWYAAG